MRTTKLGMTALLLASAACGKDAEPEAAPGNPPGAGVAPAAAPAPPPDLRLEVDVTARELRVYRRDQLERTYGVAVGRPEWPTQNGSWTVTQVIWNPGWTPPPDESWTEDEVPKDPGDPDNPLGRVQLAYDPPRTIHGTNQPQSIGKAASHGSIRMRNEDAIALARLVMDAGGAHRDDSFFAEAERNRTHRYEVAIPNPIPIRVINGAADADAVEGERDRDDAPATSASPAPERRAPSSARDTGDRTERAAPKQADTARGDSGHSHH